MVSTDVSNGIRRLAELIAARNEWECEVSAMIGRPALIKNIAECIAAHIFHIRLHQNAIIHKASDGVFTDGPLSGKSANIKWYAQLDDMLDLAPGYPDTYLVLSGPRVSDGPSCEYNCPWLIEAVYLFDAQRLLQHLTHVKLGISTHVERSLWDAAELYPEPHNTDYVLTDVQRDLLSLFSAGSSRSDGKH